MNYMLVHKLDIKVSNCHWCTVQTWRMLKIFVVLKFVVIIAIIQYLFPYTKK